MGEPPLSANIDAAIELRATPFFPQERYQCGPAALATVLGASGVEITAGELVDRVYVPGRKGALQAEIVAAARHYGRVPYLIEPSQDALIAEIQSGRPVLVLQNLGVSLFPRWHYAVVVGLDPVRDAIVLRSGTEKRRVTDREIFLRTWSRGERWGLVLLGAGELPARGSAADFLSALAAVEASGQLAIAEAGYEAALARWPDSVLAMLGLGNIALSRDELRAAERRYRQVLAEEQGNLIAMNNLADTLGRAGRVTEAVGFIDAAIRIAGPDHALAPALRRTRSELVSLHRADEAQD